MTVCLGNICRSPAAEAVLIRSRPHHQSVAEGEDRGYLFASVALQFVAEHFDVPDPWGQQRDVYVRMYDQLEEAADGLVRAIQDGSVEEVVAAQHQLR